MTFKNVLQGNYTSSPRDFSSNITRLEDLSMIFLRRYSQGQTEQAHNATVDAMGCLQNIVLSFLEERDSRRAKLAYDGSPFNLAMKEVTAKMVQPVTDQDQEAVCHAGAGNGRLPLHLGTPVPIHLYSTLTKLKHRHPHLINFRVEAGKHILVICPVDVGRTPGPDSVVEFDVELFCQRCHAAAGSL
ncbi:hypothetical protein QD460_10020 [Rhizobium jaguaris]|uniref:hypothetical protein n=1 Tax=Rhizobium jaguaris TaxID=1312183 RepID=UPI0039BF5E2F